MGLISKLVNKSSSQDYTMDEFDKRVRERYRGGQVHAGVDVNEATAMRFITVFSCVRVLAEAIASLPIMVYRERKGGGADKARDHQVFDLLYTEPNDEMTTVSWRLQQIMNQATSGNCYSVITFNNRGQPVDVYPIPWSDCWPYRDKDDNRIYYNINDRGKFEKLPASQVFHVPGMGFDGLLGYSPVTMAAEAIGTGMAAEQFTARFYGQGMNVGSVLETDSELSDRAFERLREDLEMRGAGLANSWRPLVLEEGMKFGRIPMPLRDAQFIEGRKFTKDDICGLFRVPAYMVGDLDRATYNNIENLGIGFVVYTLMPYITNWEKTINWKLFTKRERQQGYYAKFNVAALLRGDYKSRQEGLATMRQNGIINANEWRELDEMNPIDGPDGEAYLVNGNMIQTSTAANSSEGGDENSQN